MAPGAGCGGPGVWWLGVRRARSRGGGRPAEPGVMAVRIGADSGHGGDSRRSTPGAVAASARLRPSAANDLSFPDK
ncbi:hypothetical protein ACKI1O_34095 [Streptomyces scabiei]